MYLYHIQRSTACICKLMFLAELRENTFYVVGL